MHPAREEISADSISFFLDFQGSVLPPAPLPFSCTAPLYSSFSCNMCQMAGFLMCPLLFSDKTTFWKDFSCLALIHHTTTYNYLFLYAFCTSIPPLWYTPGQFMVQTWQSLRRVHTGGKIHTLKANISILPYQTRNFITEKLMPTSWICTCCNEI